MINAQEARRRLDAVKRSSSLQQHRLAAMFKLCEELCAALEQAQPGASGKLVKPPEPRYDEVYAAGLRALAEGEPDVFSYDPTEARRTVRIMWPDQVGIDYVRADSIQDQPGAVALQPVYIRVLDGSIDWAEDCVYDDLTTAQSALMDYQAYAKDGEQYEIVTYMPQQPHPSSAPSPAAQDDTGDRP